ncbi:MAG: HNH endonuclease family protein [Thermodesulfobacteriota bacterium]|nr:HNH endonuclease family protein [Thermodesulfobacteriota bacterium]
MSSVEERGSRYGQTWTREELILAFDLYCRIPFQQTKASNPKVQELAALIGRTPSSVARKLGNFGAFDQELQRSGISGLIHASKLDNDLIPLVYSRYHFPDNWKTAQGIDSYLLRALISGAFSGTPDQLIDDCVGKIREQNGFDLNHLFDAIRSKGRSLELTEDRFWQMGYGSDSIHLLFNLWYREFNYTPAYDNNLPQVDHIFPQSALRKIKAVSPETGRLSIVKYKQDARDQLANCMLLTQAENGAGGKADTLPEVWFADKPESYLDMHLIPKNKDLWKIDRFEDFIEERKRLIKAKFSYLLSQKTDRQVAPTGQ